MIIYRSYAEIVDSNGNVKIIELLWDDYDEAMKYFFSLEDYSRCRLVEVWKLRSQLDHVFKDVNCIANYIAKLHKET